MGPDTLGKMAMGSADRSRRDSLEVLINCLDDGARDSDGTVHDFTKLLGDEDD